MKPGFGEIALLPAPSSEPAAWLKTDPNQRYNQAVAKPVYRPLYWSRASLVPDPESCGTNAEGKGGAARNVLTTFAVLHHIDLRSGN